MLFSCLLHTSPVMEFGFCLKIPNYSPHSKTGTLTIPYPPASSLLLMSPGLPHSALGTGIVFMGKMFWVNPRLMSAELSIFKSPRSFCLQKTMHTEACAVPDTQCMMITNWKLLFKKCLTQLFGGKNLVKLISRSRKFQNETKHNLNLFDQLLYFIECT